ncbi:adenylyl-sulfate kinase [Paraburkholderia sp. BR14263]|uniref:adenylyl-sulfate kinase n=1 Tax=unclassified Paraburkholderia TaxID=2615204 RepID=UPI0034CDD0B3
MIRWNETEGLPPTIWLTGLSGAGKSTIAFALCSSLRELDTKAIVLDSDEIRQGVCSDLGFSRDERTENIRRIAHIARLFAMEGYVVVVAAIAPQHAHRELARSIIGHSFLEVFVSAPLEVCIARDPKGLYALARKGSLSHFTGVSAAYESPSNPDLVIDTTRISVKNAVSDTLQLLNASANRAYAGALM